MASDTKGTTVAPPTGDGATENVYDYSNFYYSSSDDLFAIFEPYDEWWYGSARKSGYYLFSQPMSTRPGPQINLEDQLTHEHRELILRFVRKRPPIFFDV